MAVAPPWERNAPAEREPPADDLEARIVHLEMEVAALRELVEALGGARHDRRGMSFG